MSDNTNRWSVLRRALWRGLTEGSYEERSAFADAWASHIEQLEEIVRRRVQPVDIGLPWQGYLPGAFLNRYELDVAAWVVVAYQQSLGGATWAPMALGEVLSWIRSSAPQQLATNPVWTKQGLLPGIPALVEVGLVEGWVIGDPFSVGRVTPSFKIAVAKTVVG